MRLKSVLFSYVFLLLLLAGAVTARASHIFGGELLYKHLSGNTYLLTMTLYGDCSSGVSGTLPGSVPRVYLYKGNVYDTVYMLKVQDPVNGLEVSPVCPRQLDQTYCKGGTLPGVKKFVYTDTITLPSAAANWRFIFAGALGVSQAGRSQNITNVINAGSSSTYFEATLNNLTANNSSPAYTSIPTPYYCMNEDQQYNQGAIDSDGDSLVYELVPALSGGSDPASAAGVGYVSPYSGEEPLATLPGEFTFSNINGQLTFTPSIVQNALVVCKVYEYRGGVLIGTSQREMTFIVSSDCEGTPPTLKMVNVNGGSVTGKNIVNICVGASNVSFGITVKNPDKDTTIITPRNVPDGATLIIAGNNTPNPSIFFTWPRTDTLRPGAYTFYLDVKNDHCPIANRQTIAYTINVTPYPTVTVTPLQPTNCVHAALMKYELALGYLPRIVTITSGSRTIATYTDTTGQITDSLQVGNYTITVASDPLCAVSDNFSITDGGVLPLDPVAVYYCQRDAAMPVQVPVKSTASTVTWYDVKNNVVSGPPTPSTEKPATYEWFVTEQYKVCTSAKVPVKVVVYPLPVPQITTNPATICYGDTLFLEATGGVRYIWGPADRVLETTDGRPFTRLTTAGTYTVKAITEYGCADSTSIRYNKIESCCTFIYPSAFTPNGDGKNDGFRISTPGNLMNYKLSVYNRWGQLVFLSYNASEYWYGTQQQVPCEAGTYFYFFEGMCQTGMTEKHKGDLTLIR